MTCSSAFNGLLVLGTDQGELLIFQLIKVTLSARPFWNCPLSIIVLSLTSNLLVSFSRPAHLLPVSRWLAQTADQSWRSVYQKTSFRNQLWSRRTRLQNQLQSLLEKMNGWVRSQLAERIAPSQLSRSSLRGLFRSPTYFRWGNEWSVNLSTEVTVSKSQNLAVTWWKAAQFGRRLGR